MERKLSAIAEIAIHVRLCFVALILLLSLTPARADILIGLGVPLSDTMAWFGEQYQRGVDMAITVLNRTGGVLGQPLQVVVADDYCEGEQAVAAAKKLVAQGIVFVAGHV